ncbi:flagellar motor switch protein FliM [Providencia sneebia]|uniref:Flagellar motor switch protein FliM n=1 Tax=Providencia sneebia DSM 19967 TaxID=1141660 RepID=K8WM70_9GAMM|nr:flagellar motor switch protein FliM [Providencia sneebia DSM 19967]
MSDNILSQADSNPFTNKDLLSAHRVTDENPENSCIRPYNPKIQQRSVNERMLSLEIINEHFAQQFRIGLLNIFNYYPNISVGSTKIEPYHQFKQHFSTPINLNIVHMLPLNGTALFTLEPTLVYAAIENLFGGNNRLSLPSDGKQFTNTEQRIINRILMLALNSYQDAWKIIKNINIEYIRSETQIDSVKITNSSDDMVVTSPFSIKIDNTISEFNICIPLAMLVPLREQLINSPLKKNHQENKTWKTNLMNKIKCSEIKLKANFTDVPLQISRLLQLQKGDVIPIEKPDHVLVSVDEVPILACQYGTLNGQYALRVEHLINPILNITNEDNTNE